MDYPGEFSVQARARVESEELKANRELEQSLALEPSKGWTKGRRAWDQCAFYTYVLRVFLAFAGESCKLGQEGTWPVDRIRSKSEGFLRRFAVQAYYARGRDRTGSKLPEIVSNWNGSLLREVEQMLRMSDEWHQFEDELLAVAERQAEQSCHPVEPNPRATSMVQHTTTPPEWEDIEISFTGDFDAEIRVAGTQAQIVGI